MLQRWNRCMMLHCRFHFLDQYCRCITLSLSFTSSRSHLFIIYPTGSLCEKKRMERLPWSDSSVLPGLLSHTQWRAVIPNSVPISRKCAFKIPPSRTPSLRNIQTHFVYMPLIRYVSHSTRTLPSSYFFSCFIVWLCCIRLSIVDI